MAMDELKAFTADDDGARLNALLSRAGSKLIEVSAKTFDASKAVTQKAVEGGKFIAEKTQDAVKDFQANREHAKEAQFCTQCGHKNDAQAIFCSKCGSRLKEQSQSA
jgi:ribosomal protein L40E